MSTGMVNRLRVRLPGSTVRCMSAWDCRCVCARKRRLRHSATPVPHMLRLSAVANILLTKLVSKGATRAYLRGRRVVLPDTKWALLGRPGTAAAEFQDRHVSQSRHSGTDTILGHVRQGRLRILSPFCRHAGRQAQGRSLSGRDEGGSFQIRNWHHHDAVE